MTSTPLRAWTYSRVSTTDQAIEGTSLVTQREQTSSYVNAKGWDLVEEIADEGVSGAKDTRPGLDRLMSACRAGQVDVVVVAKLDRFSRSLKHLVNAVGELDDLGVVFVSVSESIDSSTTTGRMLRSLLGTFAEFERDRITERMTGGLRSIANDNYWPGGPPPYGFDIVPADNGTKHKVLAINEHEAEVLRLATKMIINDGDTGYSVAAHLNSQGVTTRSGGEWRHSNLRHQLRRTDLTGTWTYNQGNQPIELRIPAILTQEEWDRLQTAIQGRPRPQRKNRLYPLSGRGPRQHLYCRCGASMTGVVRIEKGRAYYTCATGNLSFGVNRCPHQPRRYRAVELEQAVVDHVRGVITNPDQLRQLAEAYMASIDTNDARTHNGRGSRHVSRSCTGRRRDSSESSPAAPTRPSIRLWPRSRPKRLWLNCSWPNSTSRTGTAIGPPPSPNSSTTWPTMPKPNYKTRPTS